MLEKVSLFGSKRDFFLFILACGFILSYSLLIEFNNYTNLTKFDSQLIQATVLKQYTKSKIRKNGKMKTYQVLKLKSEKGFSFYTTAKKSFPESKSQKISLEIWAGKITFYEYMSSFFVFSKITDNNAQYIPTLKEELNSYLATEHENNNITKVYQALYTASPLSRELQAIFSTLGVSHLLAISGFHLGVLSTLLFFLFKIPYTFFQNRFFPYRSYKLDSFIVISVLLLGYLLFLDSPPSLLRAYVMLVIGFILYDRGFKIVSMWTLLLTAIIILSFSPRLFFSLGFWLSVSGVFYIFLFLIHFKHLNKVWQFILVPFWVYLMMLPLSLFIFENFSVYHPLSILWTSIFTLFYPLSIVLHLIGFANLLDNALVWILELNADARVVGLSWEIITLFITLSFLSIWKKSFLYVLLSFALFIFIYAIYNVT
ncbi:MAG: competence protein ComEC [Sulfurimonas sp.]|jgi:competence protein ComEC|uniref:ComEC/Rec2 family competence protein n=1 Tax=Sulfurimonas sp. TaxID=2022749 RepID=UPI0039E63CBE